MPRFRLAPVALAPLLFAAPAHAAPEEIQVYLDELNAPGEIGLEVHVNYVPTGLPGIDYEGEQASVRRLRYTPEFSLGLPGHFELGFYPVLGTIDRDGRIDVHGTKARIKWQGPVPKGARWWWGANFELSYEDRALSINPSNAELKGFIGGRFGRWTLAANLNADFVAIGREPAPLSFDLDTRISYKLSKKVEIGVEAYDGFGSTRDFGAFAQSEQTVYAVIDVDTGAGWAVNFGIGHGFGANPDDVTLKAIVSVPIGRRRGAG